MKPINDINAAPQKLDFNRAQLNFIFNLPYTKYAKAIWGRGTGKSTIIAWLMHLITERMPRACGIIQGATFQQLLTRTLPGTFAALEKLGYQKDIDYFVNKFPPHGLGEFYLPYQCPLTPVNCIFLVNRKTRCSVGFKLFSQDRSSSRGPNTDFCICDESLLLDIDKFITETKPTIRANQKEFKNVPMHLGIFHFSSMPHGESFLFEDNDYYEEDGLRTLDLRDKVVDMQLEFIKASNKQERMELWSEILDIEKDIKFYSKNQNYYSEYNAFDNIKALGLKYIIDQLQKDSELLFCIEILNKRIGKIADAFYANFNPRHHGYKGSYDYSYIDNLDFDLPKIAATNSLQDLDCLSNMPLDIGLDYGTKINWLVVGQFLQTQNQYNVIKSFYVKSPFIIDDVIKEFCTYYQHHKNKTVYFYADAEGNSPRANIKGQTTYNEQVIKLLRDSKWVVINKATNKTNPQHHLKYLLFARIMNPKTENRSKYPVFRINLINCKPLVVSMENTPAVDNNSRIGKDKTGERKLKTNREQAPDGGDALDQVIYGRFSYLINDSTTIVAGLF